VSLLKILWQGWEEDEEKRICRTEIRGFLWCGAAVNPESEADSAITESGIEHTAKTRERIVGVSGCLDLEVLGVGFWILGRAGDSSLRSVCRREGEGGRLRDRETQGKGTVKMDKGKYIS
jgi:hypothetical protein